MQTARRRHLKFLSFVFAAVLLTAGCDRVSGSATDPGAEKKFEPLTHEVSSSQSASDQRLGIILHGYGADESDLIYLARRVGLQGPLIAFRGPHAAGRGFSWFATDFTARGVRYDSDAADEIADRLAANIRAVSAEYPESEVVVLGFSQGAILATMLAVEHPTVVDRAVSLSGALPRPLTADGPSAPLFVGHGTSDQTIPIRRAREAKKLLRKSGAEFEYREYAGMNHSVGSEVVQDVRVWLNEE